MWNPLGGLREGAEDVEKEGEREAKREEEHGIWSVLKVKGSCGMARVQEMFLRPWEVAWFYYGSKGVSK